MVGYKTTSASLEEQHIICFVLTDNQTHNPNLPNCTNNRRSACLFHQILDVFISSPTAQMLSGNINLSLVLKKTKRLLMFSGLHPQVLGTNKQIILRESET